MSDVTNSEHAVYSVKEGESFNRIAIDFGLNLTQLATANPDIKDPSHLQTGQEIFIPKNADANIVHEKEVQ